MHSTLTHMYIYELYKNAGARFSTKSIYGGILFSYVGQST